MDRLQLIFFPYAMAPKRKEEKKSPYVEEMKKVRQIKRGRKLFLSSRSFGQVNIYVPLLFFDCWFLSALYTSISLQIIITWSLLFVLSFHSLSLSWYAKHGESTQMDQKLLAREKGSREGEGQEKSELNCWRNISKPTGNLISYKREEKMELQEI